MTGTVLDAKAIETEKMGSSTRAAKARKDTESSLPRPPDDPGIEADDETDALDDSEDEYGEEFESAGAGETKPPEAAAPNKRSSRG